MVDKLTIRSHSIKAISGVDIAASWNPKDKPIILELFKQAKDHPMIAQNLYNNLVDNIHGRPSALYPRHIGYTTNTMTQDGIQRHGELIVMRTNKLFTYFGIGEGAGPTTSQTQQLFDEIGRVSMDSDHGFRVSAGTNIIEAGYFDETYPSFTATESAAFDGDGTEPDIEVMEWRAVYPVSQRVAHVQNVNFMTYIHTIFQRAV